MNYPSDIVAGVRWPGNPEDDPDWAVLYEQYADEVYDGKRLAAALAEIATDAILDAMVAPEPERQGRWPRFVAFPSRQAITDAMTEKIEQILPADYMEAGAHLDLWEDFASWHERIERKERR